MGARDRPGNLRSVDPMTVCEPCDHRPSTARQPSSSHTATERPAPAGTLAAAHRLYWRKRKRWGKGNIMMSVLCVGAGGFVGAVSRYGLGLIPLASGLPLVTLLINFTGSVVIGAVAEAASLAPTALPREAVLFLKVGLCGGFTTFSTFSLETLDRGWRLRPSQRRPLRSRRAGGQAARPNAHAGRVGVEGLLDLKFTRSYTVEPSPQRKGSP